MIKYIGSKRLLVPRIVAAAVALPEVSTVCDLFAGTTRVGQGLKRAGLTVTSNDLATYSEVLGLTYIACDAAAVDRDRLQVMLDHLNGLEGVDGYVTRTFCEEAWFFQPANGRKIDAIRAQIDDVAQTPDEHAILLTALLLAADRVDSTTGVQMAFLKQWAKRSFNPLELRLPELLDGTGTATRVDANDLARNLAGTDCAYIDPPYNQHAYRSNYHVWETIVRNDEPEAYGKARKRIDCRTEKSRYNRRREATDALEDLLANIDVPHVIVSFSNEGFVPRDDIERMLNRRWATCAVAIPHKRYVGAQIGIHDLTGRKVGSVSHLDNTEYLFIGAQNMADARAAATAAVNAAGSTLATVS